MKKIINFIVSLVIIFTLNIYPASAARDTNSYDGNIYPIYAGNGSLVPPPNSLSDSLKNKRTSVIVYYLDDTSSSKEFAPVVSGIKLLWSSAIDLLPLTTDEIQGKETSDKSNPAYYWHGNIPQVVILSGDGEVLLDEEGQVSIDQINEAISKSTGLNIPEFEITIKSFNEYNSEPSKVGYDDPRGTT